MLTFLLTLALGCPPTLQTEEISRHDTQLEEEIVFGIQTDGVCGHSIEDEICDLILKDQNDDVWRLYDLEGNVIVLDFSAMWCAPCQNAASTVQEMQDDNELEGFSYVTILIDDPTGGTIELNEVQAWADTYGIATAAVLQGDRDLINFSTDLGYPISSWPTFVFVDRDLNIFWGIYGYSEEYMRIVIEDML